MPDIVYAMDQRLVGGRAPTAARAGTRIIVANPLTRRVVSVGVSGSAPNVASAQMLVQAQSDELPAAPKALAAAGGYVYALGEDELMRFADDVSMDADDFAPTAFDVDCLAPRWIAARGGFVFLPAGMGGVQAYASDGSFVASYEGILATADAAALDSSRGILYLLDASRGRLVACTIADDGSLAIEHEVAIAGTRGFVAASLGANYLAIASRNRIAIASLADRLAPAYAGALDIDGYAIADIAGVGNDRWWIATDRRYADQADRFDYGSTGATSIDGIVYALSSATGRLVGEGNFTAITPSVVIPDPPSADGPVATFYLLTEASEIIADETGGRLRQETSS